MKLSYQDLDNAAANGNGDFISNAANAAKGKVCGMYHDYKNWYGNNINLASPPGKLIEQLWDNLCPLEPPFSENPPLLPPFSGGQCQCVLYKFPIFVNGQFGDNPRVFGPIISFQIFYQFPESQPSGQVSYQVRCHGSAQTGCLIEPIWIQLAQAANVKRGDNPYTIGDIVRNDGQPDTCGNPPAPSPLSPPKQIDDIVPVGSGDDKIDLPISIKPEIQLPGFNINVFAPIFKPELNIDLNPQFNLNPKFNFNPTLNFNFGSDGVDVGVGSPGGGNDNDTINNISNNINNINDTVNNINNTVNDNNDDITIIKDKLDCDPCEKLEDIKEILTYKPVYTSASTGEFQSITRDNLFNLGYLEIDITRLPNSSKIIFGNNADNKLYTGWLTWRMNGYNFECVQISSEKSVYYPPKNANGFGIVCTNNARAICYYYIEVKD